MKDQAGAGMKDQAGAGMKENEVQEPAAPGGSARAEPSLDFPARASARGAEPSLDVHARANEQPFRLETVGLGDRAYAVRIGPGLLHSLGATAAALTPAPSAVILVVDQALQDRHLPLALASLEQAALPVRGILPVAGGEGAKSLESYARQMEALLALNPDRRALLVAFGGGVIGDLAGFMAASCLRGIRFIQIPSTLLAMVDSSVGGKTGINAAAGKNLIGAFHQPVAVLADTRLLQTLPAREWRAGYAEIAKYGALGDRDFFAWLEVEAPAVLAGQEPQLSTAIARSVAAKAGIVARDETETGERALLNLGHTFGHALESLAGFDGRLLHGEAVAIGMVLAFRLSVALGLCPAADAARLERHLAAQGLPVAPPAFLNPAGSGGPPVAALMAAMARDKKAEAGSLTLILAHGLGQAFIAKAVPPEPIARLWADAFAGAAA